MISETVLTVLTVFFYRMHQPKTIILLPKPNERIKKKVNENATVLGVKLIQRNDKKHFFSWVV